MCGGGYYMCREGITCVGRVSTCVGRVYMCREGNTDI